MVKSLKLNSFNSILFLVIAVASLTLGSARLSWADSYGQEMQEYHRFLHNHPRIAADLERDPGLASNPRYLSEHDSLRQFLHSHPQLQRQLAGYRGPGSRQTYYYYPDQEVYYYPRDQRYYWRDRNEWRNGPQPPSRYTLSDRQRVRIESDHDPHTEHEKIKKQYPQGHYDRQDQQQQRNDDRRDNR